MLSLDRDRFRRQTGRSGRSPSAGAGAGAAASAMGATIPGGAAYECWDNTMSIVAR